MELVLQVLHLCGRETGAVAAAAVVYQGAGAPVLVGACPVQEAARAAGTYIGKLGDGMSQSIESHGLIARLGTSVLTMHKGRLQLVGLLFRQAKAASSHTSIMKCLSDLSIRAVISIPVRSTFRGVLRVIGREKIVYATAQTKAHRELRPGQDR